MTPKQTNIASKGGKVRKCVECKKHEIYDSNGLCSVCNYMKMMGLKAK